MPTGLTINQVYRCVVDGTDVFTSTDITQNEHLEDLATMVADVEIVNFPAPSTVASALSFQIIRTDAVTEMGRKQFTGVLNSKDAVGYPNRVKLSATGALANLRRAPLHDHDLTGMTDITAARHILTGCNVSYTSADISGFGYTLGAIKPIIWKKGTTGLAMLQELDKVFACATMEIGSGRVVRFIYDRVPASGDISITYIKGHTLTYYGSERKLGDLESIQNFWQIGGLSYTSDSDGNVAADGASDTCQATLWGSAYATNAKIDGYSSPNSLSSDLIQSEGLAKQIAARMMRWWNRETDTLTVEAVNDPAVVPGLVIGVQDPSYGVDLTTMTPYLILGIDRSWDVMKLTCVGGGAGDEGTVTAGLNVCCGTQQSDGTCVENGANPALSDWPAGDFPPFPAFASFPLPDFEPESLLSPLVCPACDASPYPLPGTDWQLEVGTTGPWTFDTDCMIAHGDAPAHNVFWAVTGDVSGKLPLTGDVLVQFMGHVSWLGGEPNPTGTGSAYITFGLLSPDASADSLMVTYLINDSGMSSVSFAGSVGGAGNSSGDYSVASVNAQEFDFIFTWDPATTNYSIALFNGLDYTVSGTGADLTGDVGSFLLNSWTDAVLAPPLDVMVSCMELLASGAGVTLFGWHTITGTFNQFSDTEIHLTGVDGSISDGYADSDDTPFGSGTHVVFSGDLSNSRPPTSGIDAPITSIGLASVDGSNFTGIQTEYDPAGAFPEAAFLYIYVDGSFMDQLDLVYGNAINAWHFSLDFNFPAGTFDVLWTSSGVSDVIWSGALSNTVDLYPYAAYASGTSIEVDISAIDLAVS